VPPRLFSSSINLCCTYRHLNGIKPHAFSSEGCLLVANHERRRWSLSRQSDPKEGELGTFTWANIHVNFSMTSSAVGSTAQANGPRTGVWPLTFAFFGLLWRDRGHLHLSWFASPSSMICSRGPMGSQYYNGKMRAA
jgi:hypothetical protein